MQAYYKVTDRETFIASIADLCGVPAEDLNDDLSRSYSNEEINNHKWVLDQNEYLLYKLAPTATIKIGFECGRRLHTNMLNVVEYNGNTYVLCRDWDIILGY